MLKLITVLLTGTLMWYGAGTASAAEPPIAGPEDVEPARTAVVPDYGNWYQIEIIVFANRDRPDSDEIWPLAEPVYPANMAAVGPHRDQDIKPYSFSQLDDLMAPAHAGGVSEGHGAGDFMFEDKSRSNRDAMVIRSAQQPDAAEDQAKLLRMNELFAHDLPQAFRMLGPEAFNLSGPSRSLSRSTNYRVLEHLAWLQPLDDREIPVLIQAGERHGDDFEVDGTIMVSRSRYLHVDTNLWFTEFIPRFEVPGFGQMEDPEPDPDLDPDLAGKYPQLAAWAQQRNTHLPLQVQKLTQSRRMRSGEMHYIDHPFFGLIVRVDEFEYETAGDTGDTPQ